jgi:hypothetical protein
MFPEQWSTSPFLYPPHGPFAPFWFIAGSFLSTIEQFQEELPTKIGLPIRTFRSYSHVFRIVKKDGLVKNKNNEKTAVITTTTCEESRLVLVAFQGATKQNPCLA